VSFLLLPVFCMRTEIDNSLQVPTEIKTFHVNQTFAPYNTSDFFKPEVLQAWNDLMPGKTPTSHHITSPPSTSPHPPTYPH
jgi:hypothetical protein